MSVFLEEVGEVVMEDNHKEGVKRKDSRLYVHPPAMKLCLYITAEEDVTLTYLCVLITGCPVD